MTMHCIIFHQNNNKCINQHQDYNFKTMYNMFSNLKSERFIVATTMFLMLLCFVTLKNSFSSFQVGSFTWNPDSNKFTFKQLKGQLISKYLLKIVFSGNELIIVNISFHDIQCRNDELSWLFTNRLSATRLMKEIEDNRNFEKDLAISCKSSESFSKQPTQLIKV